MGLSWLCYHYLNDLIALPEVRKLCPHARHLVGISSKLFGVIRTKERIDAFNRICDPKSLRSDRAFQNPPTPSEPPDDHSIITARWPCGPLAPWRAETMILPSCRSNARRHLPRVATYTRNMGPGSIKPAHATRIGVGRVATSKCPTPVLPRGIRCESAVLSVPRAALRTQKKTRIGAHSLGNAGNVPPNSTKIVVTKRALSNTVPKRRHTRD